MDAPPPNPENADALPPEDLEATTPPPEEDASPEARPDGMQLELGAIRTAMDAQASLLNEVYTEKQALVGSFKEAQLSLEQQKRVRLKEDEAVRSPRQMALHMDRPPSSARNLPTLDEVSAQLEQARIAQTRLSALERKAESANRCVQEARRRLDRQEEELKSLRQGTGRTEQALASQMEKTRAELRDAIRQISEANRKLALREEEYRALQQRASQKEQALNKQVASLQEQLALAAATAAARTDKTPAPASMKSQVDKELLDSVRRQAAKREEGLLQEIDQLRRELDTALGAMETVKEQIGAFRQEHLAEQSEQESRETEYQDRMAALDQELAQARHDLAAARDGARDLGRQLEEQEQRWTRQQAALEQRLQRAEAAGEDREARERRIQELQEALAREKKKRDELLTAVQTEIEPLQTLNAELSQAIETRREEFRILADQFKRREEAFIRQIEDATGTPFTQRKLFDTLSENQPPPSPE